MALIAKATSHAVAGLILFAHGSRDPRWAAPFEAIAQRVRESRPEMPLRLAFLELMSPGLAEAGAQLAAAGCTQVAVLPLFLGTGGHLRNDLPRLVDRLRTDHPGVQFTLHEAVGEMPPVIAALADAAAALLPPPAAR